MKHSKWHEAISIDYIALIKKGTWELVHLFSHFNVIGNKYIFKVKWNPNGTIQCYKARLVAKGFHQR